MINVKDLTTDSHKQIRAYLRKERPEIEHQFDVWHVGKNIKKKIVKPASEKIVLTLINGLKQLKSLLVVLCVW